VSERDGALEVEAELPGVDPAGVEITLEGDLLTIAGEKKTERERAEGGVARIRERSWGAFSRAIRLPFEPEEKGVEAMFANGVLKVTMKIPEGAHAAPKRIAVKAA
jgi:Molecular chaperone (small heat shock protein)